MSKFGEAQQDFGSTPIGASAADLDGDLFGDYASAVGASASSVLCDLQKCITGSAGDASSSSPLFADFLSDDGFFEGAAGGSSSSPGTLLAEDLLKSINGTMMGMEEGAADGGVGNMTSWVLAITLSLLVVVTIVGNVLVCLAVILVRKLRKPQNYLLVSLAMADLFVALFVMPFGIVVEFNETVWPLNKGLCDLWVSADVLCCTASILNLCAISVDRYQAITAPFDYSAKSTPRKMIAVIIVVWLVSACVSLPPVLLLGNEYETENHVSTCTVSQNSWYQIYATMASFYVPLFVMLFVYAKILKVVADKKKQMQPNVAGYLCVNNTQEQQQQEQEPHLLPIGSLHQSPPCSKKGSTGGQSMTMATFGAGDSRSSCCSTTGGPPPPNHHKGSNCTTCSTCSTTTMTTTTTMMSPHKMSIASSTAAQENGGLRTGGRASIPHSNGASKFLLPGSAMRAKKHRLFSGLKEHKASTTLGIIMSAFIICWLPFFVLALARPISGWDIPRWVTSLFNWLGWAGSALNPVIYATLNRDFRLPFKEMLCFRCGTLDTLMRRRYYKDQYGDDSYPANRNKRSLDSDDVDVQPTSL